MVFPPLNHNRTQWYNKKNYRFKITKVERFFIIKILHNHKFHLQLRPAMGWHQCHLIVVSALLQLQHLFLTFVKLLLTMSFFFVFLSLRILQYHYSVVCTSVGYKQLTGRRIKFLVLLTFTFASRTNPSLLFSNSTTIANLSMSRHQTLPKLLQLFSRRLSKYSRYHTDQKCSTIFCNIHSFPTNHCLCLLQNQFLPQFYFHDLSFSHIINNLALKHVWHIITIYKAQRTIIQNIFNFKQNC